MAATSYTAYLPAYGCATLTVFPEVPPLRGSLFYTAEIVFETLLCFTKQQYQTYAIIYYWCPLKNQGIVALRSFIVS